MILYCDTSSLVKLYIEEAGSAQVRASFNVADMVATCRVALPEMFSALTRRLNSGDVERVAYESLVNAIRSDWPHIIALDFSETDAADLVERFGLRGFDAVHLSSALRLAGRSGVALVLSSFDVKLNSAAESEGLNVLKICL